MPPQLNIKDAETSALVRELAALTGESQTEAVRKAVRERLARKKEARAMESGTQRLERERENERIMAEIRKIQADVAKHMRPEDFLTDDDLYDEWGLPK